MIKLEEKFNSYYKHLEERFSDENTRHRHFERHKNEFRDFPFKDEEEYEQCADAFVKNENKSESAFDDEADWVGYVDSDDRRYLYNRQTGIEVVYKYDGRFPEPTIITYYIPKPGMFEKMRDIPDIVNGNDYTFKDELPIVKQKLAELEAKKAEEEKEQAEIAKIVKEINSKKKGELAYAKRKEEKAKKAAEYAKRHKKKK